MDHWTGFVVSVAARVCWVHGRKCTTSHQLEVVNPPFLTYCGFSFSFSVFFFTFLAFLLKKKGSRFWRLKFHTAIRKALVFGLGLTIHLSMIPSFLIYFLDFFSNISVSFGFIILAIVWGSDWARLGLGLWYLSRHGVLFGFSFLFDVFFFFASFRLLYPFFAMVQR